jgi:transposase
LRGFWYIRVGKEVILQHTARRRIMAWFRVRLTEDEQRIANEERANHPSLHVRGKMLTIWLLHCGLTREKAGEIVGVSRATVQRYLDAYQQGGLDGLRRSNRQRPVSELAAFRDIIRTSFEDQPVSTIAEACDRIEKLTGIRRGLSQVRKFLKSMGLKWQRVRAIPVPPKKTWPSTSRTNPSFSILS